MRCGEFKFIEVPTYRKVKDKYTPEGLEYELNRIRKENSEKEYHGTLSIEGRVFLIVED